MSELTEQAVDELSRALNAAISRHTGAMKPTEKRAVVNAALKRLARSHALGDVQILMREVHNGINHG